jgi:hypothetical protein
MKSITDKAHELVNESHLLAYDCNPTVLLDGAGNFYYKNGQMMSHYEVLTAYHKMQGRLTTIKDKLDFAKSEITAYFGEEDDELKKCDHNWINIFQEIEPAITDDDDVIGRRCVSCGLNEYYED